jgi:hypothetical protein
MSRRHTWGGMAPAALLGAVFDASQIYRPNLVQEPCRNVLFQALKELEPRNNEGFATPVLLLEFQRKPLLPCHGVMNPL